MVRWLAAWVAGIFLQLQQVALWSSATYAGLGAAGLLLAAGGAATCRADQRVLRGLSQVAVLLAAATLGAAYTGGRAIVQQRDLLAPGLEQRALWLEGTLAGLPQATTDGSIVRVEVDAGGLIDTTARADGPALPRQVRLFWPQAPQDLSAGQRWRWQVRLRAPHGLANPFGFDRELWLWEQGVGATGTVRVGRHDRRPERLGDGGGHHIDRWRGAWAAAVRERVADPRTAGVLAALLVGDQAAIAGVR